MEKLITKEFEKIRSIATTSNFFRFVRALESKIADERTGSNEKEFAKNKNRIIFRSNRSLGFPKSEIGDLDEITTDLKNSEAYRLTVNFMGLVGQSTPLPIHYTEDLRGFTDDENTVRHFVDFFQHRITSNIVDIWKKYHHYETNEADYEKSIPDRYLFNLVGVDRNTIVEAGLRPAKFKKILPLMTSSVLTRKSLEKIVANYTGVETVSIRENLKTKSVLDNSQLNRIGRSNSTLGKNAILGGKVENNQSKFGLDLGPMDYSQYKTNIENGESRQEIRALIDTITNRNFDVEINAIVDSKDMPKLSLKRAEARTLGRNAWLGNVTSENVVVKLD